jgi:hypothetical protein
MSGLGSIDFSMDGTTSLNACGSGPSSGMKKARDKLVMSS